MARRRQGCGAGHFVTGVVVLGLFVGTGAVTACTVPVRRDNGASTDRRPPQ